MDRHYGFIAEGVYEAGLEEFVLLTPPDENGERQVDGLAHDRLWILLVPLVRNLLERIARLEQELLK